MIPLLLAATTFIAAVAADFNATLLKAERFYRQGEWASASAMYSLLLDERPSQVSLYAPAIVAEGMRADTAAQIGLMRQAMTHHVPFDSLFSGVEKESLALGRLDIYEHFLTALREAEPWLTRSVDGRLLAYYAYRRYPRSTVSYALDMLRGLPDNEPYLYDLAQGYLGEDSLAAAEAVYSRIVALNPDAVEALLYLGNAALDGGDTVAAGKYLRRAMQLRPTPHLEKLLTSLESAKKR